MEAHMLGECPHVAEDVHTLSIKSNISMKIILTDSVDLFMYAILKKSVVGAKNHTEEFSIKKSY